MLNFFTGLNLKYIIAFFRKNNLNRYVVLLPVNMLQELSLAFQRDRFVTFGLLDYVCRTHYCVPVSGDKYGWKTPRGKWYPMWVALCDHYLIFASSWFLLDSHSGDQCDQCDWHSGKGFFTHTVGKIFLLTQWGRCKAVSYTHLTLPTIYSV